MEKDGYWLGATGYGYGYPIGGYGGFGYGYGLPMGEHPAAAPIGDHIAVVTAPEVGGISTRRRPRPVTIMCGRATRSESSSPPPTSSRDTANSRRARSVLATTRDIYKVYVADMHSGRVPMADVPGWRKQQIAAAKPVTDKNTSLRSDQLIGIEVRDPKDEALGSVDDIVMSPTTGKIAYLVIARGGIFGIGELYVPVPWADFKVTTSVSLLVLDATKGTMAAAPAVNYEEFATHGHFDQESQKVDAYWKTHLSNISTGSSKG